MFLWKNKQTYPLIITKYPSYLFYCIKLTNWSQLFFSNSSSNSKCTRIFSRCLYRMVFFHANTLFKNILNFQMAWRFTSQQRHGFWFKILERLLSKPLCSVQLLLHKCGLMQSIPNSHGITDASWVQNTGQAYLFISTIYWLFDKTINPYIPIGQVHSSFKWCLVYFFILIEIPVCKWGPWGQ